MHIEYLHPDRVLERVLDGAADLGLVSFPRESPKLAVLPWREEIMVLASSPAHPDKDPVKDKEDERLALDWKTLEYHPRQKPKFAALDMAKNVEETGARVRMLLDLDGNSSAILSSSTH